MCVHLIFYSATWWGNPPPSPGSSAAGGRPSSTAVGIRDHIHHCCIQGRSERGGESRRLRPPPRTGWVPVVTAAMRRWQAPASPAVAPRGTPHEWSATQSSSSLEEPVVWRDFLPCLSVSCSLDKGKRFLPDRVLNFAIIWYGIHGRALCFGAKGRGLEPDEPAFSFFSLNEAVLYFL